VKDVIPVLVTYFIGAVMMIEFFFVAPWAISVSASIRSWTPVITAFAVIVGTVNLVLVHGKNISRKTVGWYRSIVLLASFLVTAVLGLTVGQGASSYMFIFDNILNTVGSTMFALCAFYIGSSAFRAFQARNLQATVLLVSGVLVMIGRVPIGEYISKHMPNIAQWIMDVPNTAGQRAMMIAMGIGFVSQCLRILVGYNRKHLGAVE